MSEKETCDVCDLRSSALYLTGVCPNGCNRPQAEDHEAGIEAAVQAIIDYQNDTTRAGAMGLDRRRIAEVVIAAYLSRSLRGEDHET